MPARPLAVVAPSRWWAGFAVIGAIAVLLSTIAYRGELPAVFWNHGVDKVFHFGTAGMLAFFLDGALRRRQLAVAGPLSLPLAAVMVLVPVGIEEFFQRYALFRTSSIWDFAADVAGVAVFIPLSRRAAA